MALPNVATPYVAMTQSGRLPPCRELFALAPPMTFSCLHAPFLCAAYGPGANYVAECCGPPAILLSLGTLPTTLVRVCNTTTLNLQLSTLLFLNCLHKTPLFFTEGVSNGVTSLWHIVRLVLLCPSISSSLMYFRIPPHEPSSSLCSLSYLKP